MRIVLADPPAFTPAYDHALASALAGTGADVELVTSRFRFGASPPPDGYVRSEIFYPVSSRVFRRSRLRVPLKVLEHPFGVAALNRRRADVLHVQWLVPELDDRVLRPRIPSVFTAHDLLPRRTAAKQRLWSDLLARFDRVVVHSERGRETLAGLGIDATVIPHPVFPSAPDRHDDGRTALALGVIRPYKGLGDAVEATRRAGARLLVAGDTLEPVDAYRGDHVEWRLGYLSEADLDRALGDATVAVFPYRPELDQSGALLRALGAGVPAVAYDVGGIADPLIRFGAGKVVAPGDVEALAAAIAEVLNDPEPFRAGARRAREELTWDASARAHLALYEEIV
ncbi:MAG: glycosyltransferase family 4 protein [Acidobacteriota bacterium]|nr:glycosyltransferase family 4 protein [Acidobacteriota bacterium]